MFSSAETKCRRTGRPQGGRKQVTCTAWERCLPGRELRESSSSRYGAVGRRITWTLRQHDAAAPAADLPVG